MKKFYTNGEWKESDGNTFKSLKPYNQNKIDNFKGCTQDQVDSCVKNAKDSWDSWRDLSYTDRAEYLWEVKDRIEERKEELGKLVSMECGKEIDEGMADVTEACHMIEWAAGNARHPHGEIIPSEISSKDSYMRRKPKGVIACITPWNFPVAIPFWHMAISLVEGNTVVFKPSEKTPKCGELIAEIFDNSDIPEGVFNLVQGGGEVGSALVENEDVSTVVFTGSYEVGKNISSKVSEMPNKSCTCEMGGKNAVLVTEKANIDLAVKSAVLSAYKTTGQRCVSAERIIVHEDVYEEFKEKFVRLSEKVKVGNPLEDDTFMGPLIDKSQVNKFDKYNNIAKEEGANVLVDRSKVDKKNLDEDGYWRGPFVYEIDYDSDLRCLTDEVFGPHVALIEYSGSVENGIEINNDTDYGLAGSIISEDYRQINKYRDKAEVGLAYANLACIGAEVQLPFGGIGKSGNGLPYARELIETVTHRTAWTLNNSDDISLAQGLSAEINIEDQNK